MNLNILNLLKKPGVPESYGLKIRFVYGETEDFDVVRHNHLPNGTLELTLTDDTYCVIPLSSIGKMNFDKNFTALVEESRKAQKVSA